MKKKTLTLVLCLVAVVGVAVYFIIPLGSYFVADYQYERLVKASALTKFDVEKNLFLYTVKRIDIKDSLWGRNLKLEKDEYCQQYLILWREPIDVIYDSKGQVKRILSSFE